MNIKLNKKTKHTACAHANLGRVFGVHVLNEGHSPMWSLGQD